MSKLSSIDALLSRSCEWLRKDGQENGIVISSRIRLARNLEGFPFQTRASEQDRRAVCDIFAEAAPSLFGERNCYFVNVGELQDVDRTFLLERQLISKELAEAQGTRAALIDKHEKFCVLVNEEDHLRLNAMTGGFDIARAWKRIGETDDKLESVLQYVFHEKYGYLTACPTNVGTGMRVSVMLHLPALVISKEIEKVFRSLQKVNLAVRGLYGEGSQPVGDFFQISNQQTLGKTEEELIKKITDIVPQIVQYELQARDYLLRERKEFLLDRCNRSAGLLRTARTISSAETMQLLSSVRLGINTGILDDIPLLLVNELFMNTQPAHIQKRSKKEMNSADRDVARADYIRQRLEAG